MATQPHKGVPIDPDRVEGCLRAFGGVQDLKRAEKTPKHATYHGTYNGTPFALNLFVNNDGRCTIGNTAKYCITAFTALADHLVAQCSYGKSRRLEMTVKVPKDQVALAVEFLETEGATVESFEEFDLFSQWRVKGPRGDSLVMKAYKVGSFQVQGVHAQLASWLFDYLGTVLALDAVLEAQRAIYKIPLTTQQVKDELKGRIPAVHDYLEEAIRKQFSTAHAFSKIGVELEDYAALAFPALKGVEGFCFQVLKSECGFKPESDTNLGSYFESPYHGKFQVRAPYNENLSPELLALLDTSYSIWHKQRHSLFHMDQEIPLTRMIGSRQAALAITDEVFDSIDRSYEKYVLSKQ